MSLNIDDCAVALLWTKTICDTLKCFLWSTGLLILWDKLSVFIQSTFIPAVNHTHTRTDALLKQADIRMMSSAVTVRPAPHVGTTVTTQRGLMQSARVTHCVCVSLRVCFLTEDLQHEPQQHLPLRCPVNSEKQAHSSITAPLTHWTKFPPLKLHRDTSQLPVRAFKIKSFCRTPNMKVRRSSRAHRDCRQRAAFRNTWLIHVGLY